MNKNQKFYNELMLALNDASYCVYEKEVIKEVLKNQKKNRDEILNMISNIMLKYNISNDCMQLNPMEFNLVYKDFNKKITEMFNNEIRAETNNIKDKLKTVGEEKYNINNFAYSMGIDYKIKPVSGKILNDIVKHKIIGKAWSDRIWTNKNVVSRVLKREIKDFLKGNTNVNVVEKIIKNRFNVNATNSTRLIRTEVCRVQEEINEQWCKDHNIKKQMFMATLDGKTSKICQEHDGEVYDFDDNLKPIPPLHPNCRSCLINLVNEDWKPRQRIDNITKKTDEYKTFQEWQAEQEKKTENKTDSKELKTYINSLKDLHISEYTSRSKLGRDILDTLGLKDIPVYVKDIKDYGFCSFEFNGNIENITEYVLKSKDQREDAYKIKTAFHEAFHAKANGKKSDYIYCKKEWLQIEETFAESSSHYIMKELGYKEELCPSYSDKLVEMLPRLKQLDKFKNCNTISDFGKIALEDRLKGVTPEWAELYDEAMKVNHNWIDYSKKYKEYMKNNKEELIDKVLENMPNSRQYKYDMIFDLDRAIKHIDDGEKLTSNQSLVLRNALIVSMNRLGVK